METSRQCPECGDLVTGRRDKIFCDSICKSRYFRRHPAGPAETPARVVPLAHELRPTPVPVPEEQEEEEEEEEDEDDWRTQYQQAEDERKREAQRRKLHNLYCRHVNQFLEYANQQLSLHVATRLVRDLNRAVRDYQEHPDLTQADGVSQRRLRDLNRIRATLQGIITDINQPSIFQGWFSETTSSYSVSKKKQDGLLDRLIDRTD